MGKLKKEKFCLECGAKLENNRCKLCNKCKVAKEEAKKARFCKECGSKLENPRRKICDKCKAAKKIKHCIHCGVEIEGKTDHCDACELQPFKDLLITQFKLINDPQKYYWKNKYLRILATSIFDYSKGKKYEIYKIFHSKSTQTKDFKYLAEHVFGRQRAAELIIDQLNKNYNEKTINNLTIEETKKLMLRYASIINIQKFEKFETSVNEDLEIYQRSDITFNQYNEILLKYGYNILPESVRPYFDKN
jgi:hypothetical protein